MTSHLLLGFGGGGGVVMRSFKPFSSLPSFSPAIHFTLSLKQCSTRTAVSNAANPCLSTSKYQSLNYLPHMIPLV